MLEMMSGMMWGVICRRTNEEIIIIDDLLLYGQLCMRMWLVFYGEEGRVLGGSGSRLCSLMHKLEIAFMHR